jgi:methyltransferase (TIGR00027 family)
MIEAASAQVVLLGAGLDTRSFRLPWPAGTSVFELDREAVLDHKERVLSRGGATPRCHRQVVVADLREDWPVALAESGFDTRQAAAWLLEGLLFYLPVDRLVRVLDQVTAHAALGSRLGFDIVNAAVLTSPYTRPWVDMQAAAGAPWLGTMEDPVGFLAERGWDAALTQAGQPDANHGRWTLPVVPTSLPDFPHSWFVTATRTV